EERPFSVGEALRAKEAFITSATVFVQAVVAIDGRKVADGKPGPMTNRLREIYVDFARATAVWGPTIDPDDTPFRNIGSPPGFLQLSPEWRPKSSTWRKDANYFDHTGSVRSCADELTGARAVAGAGTSARATVGGRNARRHPV